MRILLVAQNLHSHSGWGTYARNTMQGLVARGHNVACVLEQGSIDRVCTEFTGLSTPLALLHSPFACLMSAWTIRKAIRRHCPDVLHFLVEPYVMAMPLVRKTMQTPPWTMNLHGTYSVAPLASTRTRGMMKRAYSQASAFLVCSQYTLGQVLSALNEYTTPALVARCLQLSTLFRLGIADPKLRTLTVQKDTSKKKILFVGELKPRKGVMELVQGVHVYSKQSRTPVELILIGKYSEEDPYIAFLRSFIRSSQLENIVTLRGQVNDEELEKAYVEADVFAMLSKKEGVHFEGFGLVFLEANARGIPALGSKDSGCKEAIDEGVSGFAVDAFNPDKIAERLRWILEEGRIKSEGCKAWAKQHSIEQQIDSLENVYRRLTAA